MRKHLSKTKDLLKTSRGGEARFHTLRTTVKRMRHISAIVTLIVLGSLLLQIAAPLSAFAAQGATSLNFVTPSGISSEHLEAEIDLFVNPLIGQSTPGAAIVITKDDRIVFSKGYGYANLDQQTPVDPARTVFAYGSISKLFVWTSVMQLVETGRLALDQDIRDKFPDAFRSKIHADKPFTLLDMMSHTAGFEEYSGALFVPEEQNMPSLEEVLLSAQPKQIFEPGEVMSYSNYSTALAGYAVEQVENESFFDYEREHIFLPLGINHTSGHPQLMDRPELLELEATGYGSTEGGGFEARGKYTIPYYPAGSIKGTAEDLARFAIALTSSDHPLFQDESTGETMLAQSYTPHPDMPSNAHGLWEYSLNPRTVGHSGGTVGFSSNFAVVPEERLGIIILTNAESEPELVPGLINKLTHRSNAETEMAEQQLNLSHDVAGKYLLSRNTLSTFQIIMGVLSSITIASTNEHDLTVSVMGREGDYVQIKPDLYQLKSTEIKSLRMSASYLYVERDHDNKIVRISGGQGMDMIPTGSKLSDVILLLSVVSTGASLLFFICAPLALAIRWVIRRKRGMSSTFSSLLTGSAIACGTIMVGLAIYMLCSMVLNPYAKVDLFNTCILLLWCFGIAGLLSVIAAILTGRKTKISAAQRWFRVTSLLLGGILVLNLAGWKFFIFIS